MATDTASGDALEWRGGLSLRSQAGAAVLEAGVRADATADATEVQPRARISFPIGGASITVTAARAARLYQVISELQPEPTLFFADTWRESGRNGTPTLRVDHVSVEASTATGPFRLYAGAYGSRGRGVGEFRPATDPASGTTAVRYGDSRTLGLELSAAWKPLTDSVLSATLTWIVSRSERRWDDGVWRPWLLDRRHQVRLHTAYRPAARWGLFATADFASGQPVTPVTAVIRPESPPLDAPTSDRLRRFAYLYAPEGSGRSAGTVRFDAGTELRFEGPWGGRTYFGFSIVNLAFGPVAPEQPVAPEELYGVPGTGGRVVWERAFELPAVPTLFVRMIF